ncbi:3-hydroxyacyl-CoA dehydrogenase [Candidatus Woesearchaeota archaeon]|nr:3-hydroxyacyl-CoA dehydrogenase [Candidatus Woesearchaeota archaeon]
MTRVNIEVEDELHKKAKLAAVLENKTLIEFINDAIREKVEKGKRK